VKLCKKQFKKIFWTQC